MFSLANKTTTTQSKKRTAETSLDEPTKRRKIAVEVTAKIVEKDEAKIQALINSPALLDKDGKSIVEKGYTPINQKQEDLSMEFAELYLRFLDNAENLLRKHKKHL